MQFRRSSDKTEPFEIESELSDLSELIPFPGVTICNANPFNTKTSTTQFIDKILSENKLDGAKSLVSSKFKRKISLTGPVGQATETAVNETNEVMYKEDMLIINSNPSSVKRRHEKWIVDANLDDTSGMPEDTTTAIEFETTVVVTTVSITTVETTTISSFEAVNSLKERYNTQNANTVLQFVMDDLRRNVMEKLSRVDSIARKKRESFKSTLGFGLDDMLLSCTFNGEQCSKKNFSTFWDYKYGNCYTFNGKDLSADVIKTNQPGSHAGLHLEMFVNDPNEPIRFSTFQGMYLSVHSHETDPRIADDGLFLPTGLETYLSIIRSHTTLLPAPYSNCINDLTPFSNYSAKLFNYMNNLNLDVYSQSFCYKICYQDNLIRTCDCADASIPRLNNASYCLTDDQIACQKKVYIDFSTTDSEVYCQSACPSQCETLKYSLKTFNTNYPSLNYIQILKSKYRSASFKSLEDYTQKSMLKVIVNNADLSTTRFDDTAVLTIEDIVGNVGGQLGLFIGVSILTTIELIEILLRVFAVVYKHCRNGRFRRQSRLSQVNPLSSERKENFYVIKVKNIQKREQINNV